MYEKPLFIYNKFMNQVLDIETTIIIDEELSGIISAYTDGYHIYVSQEWLNNLQDELELLVMCMHEGFHCYQRKCILNESLSPTILNQWQYEFNNYVNPREDLDAHWEQNIEQTATIFSDIALYKMSRLHLSDKLRALFNPDDVKFIESLNFKF